MSTRPGLGTWSGVGLVVANMIGGGVFISAGFMAQDMGPGWILFAWCIGAVFAICGAYAYAEVARLVPRSGGEYRYLSELVHPHLGYLAGWASLLVGFSAPVAVSALAAAAFLGTVVDLPSTRLVAAALVVAISVFHSLNHGVSRATQNGLILVKVALLGGFVAIGWIAGSHEWPTWVPPTGDPDPSVSAFMRSLFYIAFAFSGWNAAIYAADEFRRPTRDVPRAMLIGCAAVGLLYLFINWVFVANLTPEEATGVFGYSDFAAGNVPPTEAGQVTLGHAVTTQLIGPVGGTVMSILAVIAFVSSISAMTMVGPRVYAAMARDGHLPLSLAGRTDRPPRGSVWLQAGVALVLLVSRDLRTVLESAGGVLAFFTALTLFGLLRYAWRHRARHGFARPGSILTAALYVGFSCFMLYFGFRDNETLVIWIAVVAAVALVAGVLSGRHRAWNDRPG